MTDKFQPLRQALAALKLSGPVSTSAAKWNAASDALDVELVAELLAERDALTAPAAEPQATPIPCAVHVAGRTFEAGTPFCDVIEHVESTRLRGGVPEGE